MDLSHRNNANQAFNTRAENCLKRELKSIEELRLKSGLQLTRKAMDIRLEWRAQHFRALKNNLERQRAENKLKKCTVDPVDEQNARRADFWKAIASNDEFTPDVSPSPRRAKDNGFRTEVHSGNMRGRGQEKLPYRDVNLARMLQELQARPRPVTQPGRPRRKYAYQELVDRVRELHFDQYNDGTLALATRKIQKRQQDVQPFVKRNRKQFYTEEDIQNAQKTIPKTLGCQLIHKPKNSTKDLAQGTQSAISSMHNSQSGLKFELSLFERLSQPKRINAFKVDAVYIPKSNGGGLENTVKQENEGLLKIHRAEQKENYEAVLNKVNVFLGKARPKGRFVEKEPLTDEEKMVYDRLKRNQSKWKRAVRLAIMFKRSLTMWHWSCNFNILLTPVRHRRPY